MNYAGKVRSLQSQKSGNYQGTRKGGVCKLFADLNSISRGTQAPDKEARTLMKVPRQLRRLPKSGLKRDLNVSPTRKRQ